MFSSENLNNTLRAVADGLRNPVIFILLLLIGVAIVMLGTLIAEIFTERMRLKAKLPTLIDEIKQGDRPLQVIIDESGLLKRQIAALNELTEHGGLTETMRESLAVRLLYQEQVYYDRIVRITDLIARLAPMFGLMGTLIPLGPGIIALGQGDTYTLSTSFLTAFDTTIAGLIAAAAAYLVSTIRKNWYANYMSMLETTMECILEAIKDGNEIYRPEPEEPAPAPATADEQVLEQFTSNIFDEKKEVTTDNDEKVRIWTPEDETRN